MKMYNSNKMAAFSKGKKNKKTCIRTWIQVVISRLVVPANQIHASDMKQDFKLTVQNCDISSPLLS